MHTLPKLLNIQIPTERLTLSPVNLDYLEVIFDEFTPEITRYMYPRSPTRIQETMAFIRDSLQSMEQGTNLQMVILKKETGEFLGCAGIHELNTPRPELGIWLKQSAHGNGYGLETISALKEWADNNLDYEYIRYPVDEDNLPSRRIPEFLKGEVRNSYNIRSLNGWDLFILEYWIYPISQ